LQTVEQINPPRFSGLLVPQSGRLFGNGGGEVHFNKIDSSFVRFFQPMAEVGRQIRIESGAYEENKIRKNTFILSA